jgi:beta propeller repeat protein
MKRLVTFVAVAAATLVVAPALQISPAAAGVSITVTEQRITTNPGDDYDPAISGDVVVYTGNRENNTDVYYARISTGTEVAVTQLPGAQELSDVSGDRIVYADLNEQPMVSIRDVFVYDLSTGTTTNLTGAPGAYASNPAIGGDLVAWEDTRDANVEIYAYNLSSGEERRVTTSLASDDMPAVFDGRIVFQTCDLGICDITVYDWASGLTKQITATADADERRPDLDGNTVVYDSYKDGERDIIAHDLNTGVERRLSMPGSQSNPNVSGDVVAFDDVSTGNYHVALWHLPTNTMLPLTNGAGGEYLNDIDGNRVVYTAQRENQLDIWLSTFTLDVTSPYQFNGFFVPVNNGNVVNLVKAGRAVPVKFSLTGDMGLDILAADSPSSQQITCDAAAPIDLIETTLTAGGSSLSYDPATDQYTYVWKTDQAWTGTCRQLTVTFNDGATHTALFRFAK